jgi:hypothetical protein
MRLFQEEFVSKPTGHIDFELPPQPLYVEVGCGVGLYLI